MKPPALGELRLKGLELAPSQSWRGIRLVPVLRRGCPGDLRLTRRRYEERFTCVGLEGDMGEPDLVYASYIPHGLVVEWNDDGSPVAAFGAHLAARDGKRWGRAVRLMHRMVKREEGNAIRILPLHLAMEGFLALHFNGPDILWSEYSDYAQRQGLNPRSESSVTGRGIVGLEDALRVFEIHEDQVGVLVFVAEALASAFVLSHPEDYRALHETLLTDFYGELLQRYSEIPISGKLQLDLELGEARCLADLRQALERARAEWAAFHGQMANGLFEKPVLSEGIYNCGPFSLSRFSTALDRSTESHLGEVIQRGDGTVEYLKTYRLSAAQTRRAFLLRELAKHHWNLEATAGTLRQTRDELILRLEKAGFGYLVKDHVLKEARRGKRRIS